MPAIAVRDLHKVYDGKAAVDGLNLNVPRGSFFGFPGPNGAGKSTTIRMLDMPFDDNELAIKRRIGLVPDESLLLKLFELTNERRKLIAEYSKGMRKRIAMAAWLIHGPEFFLMDEPCEGVDAVGTHLMKDILLDQVRHEAIIFITTHVLEVVERLCDYAAIINIGKIVTKGRMADLRAGSEALEDVFVRMGGGGREYYKLEWLT
jgi:ABC-2 type transport system ATP-binding protein